MDILDDNSAQDTGDGGKAISAALTGMGAAIGSWWGGGAADKATTSSSTASGDATEVANEEEVEEEEEESGEEDDAEESSSDESAEAPGDGAVGWGSWLSTTLKKTADSASSLGNAASKHLDVLVEALPSDEQIVGFASAVTQTARLVATDVAREFVEAGSDSDDGFPSLLDSPELLALINSGGGEESAQAAAPVGADRAASAAAAAATPMPWDTIRGDKRTKDEMRQKILRLSGDARTFMVDPPAVELETAFAFDAESVALARQLRSFDARLKKALRLLVGGERVKELDFWRNYLYRLKLVRDEYRLREWADALVEDGTAASSSASTAAGSAAASSPTAAPGVDVQFATPDLASLERTVTVSTTSAAQLLREEEDGVGLDDFASDEPSFGSTAASPMASHLVPQVPATVEEEVFSNDAIDSLLAGVESWESGSTDATPGAASVSTATAAAADASAVTEEEEVDVDSLLADIAAEGGGGNSGGEDLDALLAEAESGAAGEGDDDLDVDALLAETESSVHI